jgi:hypothetical protein
MSNYTYKSRNMSLAKVFIPVSGKKETNSAEA